MKPRDLALELEPGSAWPPTLDRRKRQCSIHALAAAPRERMVAGRQCNLNVFEAGNADRPAILFLHGFPDCHQVWSHQLKNLSDEFHVIAFDLRGCGLSGAASEANAYLIENLLPDIEIVINAVRGPRAQVHLVGHDWGSVLGWSFVSHPEYAERVLSWSSISGVHAGLVLPTLRSQWRQGGRHARAVLGQLLRSWYVAALSLRGVGNAWLRWGGVKALKAVLAQGGVDPDDAYLAMDADTVNRRATASVALYRQNLRKLPAAPAARSITVPVQLIVPVLDRFLRPVVYEGLGEVCRHLERWDIAANHWVQRSHPNEVTQLLRSFINRQIETRAKFRTTKGGLNSELPSVQASLQRHAQANETPIRTEGVTNGSTSRACRLDESGTLG
ncbi:MAG: alpha/beta fold hydrolase [Pseudomonadota bacterium]